MLKNWVTNLAVYGLAAAIIWYLARDIPLSQLWHNLQLARLWIFIPACLGSFVIWFVGETFLFACLFSFFHQRTSFREMIAPNAAQYFLQLINLAAAGAALVLFLHRRKAAPWLTATVTMLFQSFIDFQVLMVLALLGAICQPHSMLGAKWPYAAGALAVAWTIVWFWHRGRPRWRPLRWLYDRPSMASFRQASAFEYMLLAAIRTPIFAGQGLMLFFQMLAFGIHAPFRTVMGYTPAVLLFGGLPITPVGLGPLQAVLLAGFHDFASKANLLAMALSISMMNILFRVPMGLGSAGSFAREVVETQQDEAAEPDEEQSERRAWG